VCVCVCVCVCACACVELLHEERGAWLTTSLAHVIQAWFPWYCINSFVLGIWQHSSDGGWRRWWRAGRTFGTLSTTRSKAIHKVDIPAFAWPVAPFPQLKYPLADHVHENAAEEQRCLAEVERLFSTDPKCAGLVVEPVQAEGGDNHASPAFFQGLRSITKKFNVAMIVDEVQTGGGASGSFWMHELWGLDSPPDFVTFSKKLQAAGFFHNIEYRPSESYRNFNTWMGDPVRLLFLREMLAEIKRDNLLENVTLTGNLLMDNLQSLEAKYPDYIKNTRGIGTFIAFDSADAVKRDKLVYNMRQVGMHLIRLSKRAVSDSRTHARTHARTH
jgi:4-aminobutyrate aminotransferase / (S)-3-amino-2-methylpropionate transaminase